MKLFNTFCFFLLAMVLQLVMATTTKSSTMETIVRSELNTHAGHVLMSKRSSKNKKKKHSSKSNKKYSKDCKKRTCPLVLKPCPKDCPMSCGYLNSPDPCCPLLGKPTCPDY